MREPSWSILFALCAAAPALAMRGIPVGSPLVVSHTGYGYFSQDGYVSEARVATSAAGDFVVVWSGTEQNYAGVTYNVFGRRYDGDFTPLGGEFTVASDDDSLPWYWMRPRVAMRPEGDFAVVWTRSADESPIFVRRYDPAGAPLGAATQVASSDGYGRYTALVPLPGGDFGLAWEDFQPGTDQDVFVRRFDSTLAPVGPPVQANTVDGGWDGYVDAAADPAGNFVVVWNAAYSYVDGVFARRFDATGAPLGDQFQALSRDGNEDSPVVAVAPDGWFVVASGNGTLDVRRFDAAGVPLGDEFSVSGAAGSNVAVAAGADGRFVVLWHDWTNELQEQVYGALFDAAGVQQGPNFRVSESQIDDNYVGEHPSVAPLPNGDFVVAWAHNNYADYYATRGVYVRRVAVCGDGQASPFLACDDGGNAPLDGCSRTCQVETCWTCAGEPSACSPIASCPVVCSDAAGIDPKVTLTLGRLATPAGDETVSLNGSIVSPPVAAGTYNPLLQGAEVVITGADVIWAATPVPPGGVGSGCGPLDGWKVSGRAPNFNWTYKNLTGALPPSCTPGSANGLKTLKIKDKIASRGVMQFQAKAKAATLPPIPNAPLQATIVLGQSPGAGTAGQCAAVTLGHWTNSGRTARYIP